MHVRTLLFNTYSYSICERLCVRMCCAFHVCVCVCALKVNECITHTRLKLDFIEKNSMVFVLAEVTNDPSVQLLRCSVRTHTNANTCAHVSVCAYGWRHSSSSSKPRESTYMRKQLLYIAMLFFCRCFVVSLLLLLPALLLLPLL